MNIQSDPDLDGGYAFVDRSDPNTNFWIFYIFILNYPENSSYLLNYYNENEFGKRKNYAQPVFNWQNFNNAYSEVFDGIYEFTFTNEADAVLFKLGWA